MVRMVALIISGIRKLLKHTQKRRRKMMQIMNRLNRSYEISQLTVKLHIKHLESTMTCYNQMNTYDWTGRKIDKYSKGVVQHQREILCSRKDFTLTRRYEPTNTEPVRGRLSKHSGVQLKQLGIMDQHLRLYEYTTKDYMKHS